MVKLKPEKWLNISHVKERMKGDIFKKSAIFVLLLAGISLIFFVNMPQQRYNLSIGDIATEDIYAPYDMVDKGATLENERLAEEKIQPVYKMDLTVQIGIQKGIESFFNLLSTVKTNELLDPEQKVLALVEESGISLKKNNYAYLLSTDDKELRALKDDIIYILNQILGDKITEDQLNEKRESIREFFENLQRKSTLNEIGADMAILVLRPNMFYDEQATTIKKQQARADVEEVIIKKGTVIVNKGQELSVQKINLMTQYGLLNGKNNKNISARVYIGYCVMIIIAIVTLAFYCYRFDKKTWRNNSQLLLVSFVIVLSLIISLVGNIISEYLILLPACTMLISLLVNPRVAIVSNIIMTIILTFLLGFGQMTFTAMILSGILAAIMVLRTHHRSVIIYAGLGVSLVYDMIILSFGLITFIDSRKIMIDMIYGTASGIVSSILTIGMLPFLESVFDLITPIKLLELSNPNRPLLRRLLIEAPGTYYHSILVGNLSEAAAEEVDANALLCRIGAYYHDIGKLKRPYFFKENQMTQDNPHDKITPSLSALIITSHVKDGIELAKKNNIPSSVVDIIKEHHGNTLVAYFYHKALNSEYGDTVTEEKFRYNYPRPQSKEAAIVMLADSVEAYIRSLTEPAPLEVEEGVKKIIRDKLQDNQLDACDLTLKDLDQIAMAFVKVLGGIFHDRIEYPENIKDI